LQRLNYSHDAMIDLLIANPMIQQGELAAAFGYSEPWVSRILRCDAFRERYAARRGELSDPLIMQTLEQRFEALVSQSLDKLQEKLALPNVQTDVVLKAAELGARALGYGARTAPTVNANVSFVVAMPPKAVNGEEWLAGRVIEASPVTRS